MQIYAGCAFNLDKEEPRSSPVSSTESRVDLGLELHLMTLHHMRRPSGKPSGFQQRPLGNPLVFNKDYLLLGRNCYEGAKAS